MKIGRYDSGKIGFNGRSLPDPRIWASGNNLIVIPDLRRLGEEAERTQQQSHGLAKFEK
jgi:hypothetical protein